MRNHRLISWSTIVLFLVVALACGETGMPPRVDEVTPTPESVLSIESHASPTPTYQVGQGGPFRGLFPSDVEITPDGTRAYVSCYGSNNVLVIDTSSNSVIDAIDLSGAGAFGMYVIDTAMTPDGRKLYLADHFTDKIGVVDTTADRVVAFVGMEEEWVEGRGKRIAVTPDGTLAYIVFESGRVNVMDVETDTVVKTIVIEGENLYLVEFSPDSKKAFLVGQPDGGRVYIVDTSTHTVADRIDLGFEQELQTQGSIVVSPDGEELYLASGFNEGGYEHPEIGINRVFVIDVSGRAVVDEIEVIGGPHRIRLSPDGRLAYVSTADAEAVFVLDLANRTNIGKFDWNGFFDEEGLRYKKYDLRGIALFPDGESAYLAGWDGDAIITLDLPKRRVSGVIELNPLIGAQPADIVMTPDGSTAFVSTWSRSAPGASNGVVVIDTAAKSVINGVASGSEPRRMDITPDGKVLFVASDPVLGLDVRTNEEAASIFLGKNSAVHDVVVMPAQNKLYVSYGVKDIRGGVVVVDLSSNTIVKEIDVGWSPVTMAATPDGSRLYVNRILNPHDLGELVVVDTTTDEVIDTIASPINTREWIGPIGHFTCGLAVSPDGAYVYWTAASQYINVVEVASNRIVRTLELLAALPGLHIAPSAIGFLPDGSRAYIVCLDAGFVVVLDTRTWTFLDIVRVGFRPTGIAITPDGRLAFVTNQHSEDVSVIDLATNEVIDTIPLRPPP